MFREGAIFSHVKSVLAIGAHPDDIEYGCGGTLLMMGKRVKKTAFVASVGSKGDPSSGPARAQESRVALQELGVASAHIRDHAGLGPESFETVLSDLYTFIQDHGPDLILTLGSHDTHQEHRYTYDLTVAAARRSRTSILNYSVLSNTLDFKPQVFVDIAQVFEDKKRILKLHRSQMSKYYMGEEYIEIFHSHQYASLHGIRYCESFEVVRALI